MLLLLFIPVGHRALKSNPFTLYLAGSEHSQCLTYCLLSVLSFFWRKAQQLIYVKTKVMLTCYSLFPCQLQSSSIMPRYREDMWFSGLMLTHQYEVDVLPFPFLSLCKSILLFERIPLYCTDCSQPGISDLAPTSQKPAGSIWRWPQLPQMISYMCLQGSLPLRFDPDQFLPSNNHLYDYCEWIHDMKFFIFPF